MKVCPKCGIINPPEATRCDCGWDLGAAGAAGLDAARIASMARRSWVFPLIAWGSQVVLQLLLGGVRGPGTAPIWLVAMLAQFALIIGGLYFGAKVLSVGRALVPPASWKAALAGVALSGGTILLIVVISVVKS